MGGTLIQRYHYTTDSFFSDKDDVTKLQNVDISEVKDLINSDNTANIENSGVTFENLISKQSHNSLTDFIENHQILYSNSNVTSVCFVDLDDTLIPTEWIKGRQMVIRANDSHDTQIFSKIRKEIDNRTSDQFILTICAILKATKRRSETVAIVTNARSEKWITTFKSMFPEVIGFLNSEGIEIFKSQPKDKEPSDPGSYDYFRFWVEAKKEKFKTILKRHQNQHNSSLENKIDLISIGDNEFEESATLDLLHDESNYIRLAKIIKCKAGLNPEEFLIQLNLIHKAILMIEEVNSTEVSVNYGDYVTCHVESN